MREIKFRAWDKRNKQMVEVKAIDWCDTGVISINYPHGKLYSAPEEFGGAIKLMQYTGLLDKNGKEIYEGDYDQDYNVVTWCNKKMGWTMSIYDFPTKEFIACHCYDCEGHFEIRELEDIEIIGNIYEVAK